MAKTNTKHASGMKERLFLMERSGAPVNLTGEISEIFDMQKKDPKSKQLRRWRRKSSLTEMPGVALLRSEEMNGSEIKNLKSLLKTLRVQKWDTKLYLDLRFFSVRKKLSKLSPERKAEVVLFLFNYFSLII